jgi:hypothetical protein
MVFTFGNDKMAIEGSHNNLHFRCEDQPWYMAFSASSFFSPLNKAQWTHLLGSTWPNHCLKSTCPLCKSWKPLGYGMCWVHTYIYHCAHFAAYLKKNWLVCPTRLHPNSSHAPHGAWLFLPNMDHVPWPIPNTFHNMQRARVNLAILEALWFFGPSHWLLEWTMGIPLTS